MSTNPKDPFLITRSFAARPETVFDAWTNPDQLSQWFSPAGFITQFKAADIRSGGRVHYSMSGPDGMKIWGKAHYKDVSRPNFLSYVQSFSDEAGGAGEHPAAPTWPKEMLTEIRFEEAAGGHTILTLMWTPQQPSELETKTFHEGREGMVSGWNGSFAKLDEFLSRK